VIIKKFMLALSMYSPATVRVWVHTGPTSIAEVQVIHASNNWPTLNYLNTQSKKLGPVTILINSNH
jgi:hypothetical protein